MDALRAAIASAGRDGGTTCLLSLTRHIGFLQLDDGATQRFHQMQRRARIMRVIRQLRV